VLPPAGPPAPPPGPRSATSGAISAPASQHPSGSQSPHSGPLSRSLAVSTPADFQIGSFSGRFGRNSGDFVIKFGSIKYQDYKFGTASGSGLVRAGQLVEAIQFFVVNGAISAISFDQLFRDRIGRRLDREDTKIKPSPIFNLRSRKPSVRLSVNQWVPGSSPGRGANPLFSVNKSLDLRRPCRESFGCGNRGL
jgi:hypothetical protein